MKRDEGVKKDVKAILPSSADVTAPHGTVVIPDFPEVSSLNEALHCYISQCCRRLVTGERQQSVGRRIISIVAARF